MLLALFVGDMFTELIFVGFKFDSFFFWCLLIFDVMLLVMRDADLYEPLSEYLTKYAGELGPLLLTAFEIMSGRSDDVGGRVFHQAEQPKAGKQLSKRSSFKRCAASPEPQILTTAEKARARRQMVGFW